MRPPPGADDAPALVACTLPAGRYAVAERDLADARADLVAWMDARCLVHRRPTADGWRCHAPSSSSGWPVDEPDPTAGGTTLAFLVEEA